MFPKKERVVSLLEAVDREIALLLQMTSPIACPEDFVTSLTGMTILTVCRSGSCSLLPDKNPLSHKLYRVR